MSRITRGFRHRPWHADPARLPPGRHATAGFPVLSAGPTPHTPITVDIHCVT